MRRRRAIATRAGAGRLTTALLAALALAVAADVARAGNTCTWTGSWDVSPANTDDVIVVSSGGSLTWNNAMPATVASWTQDATYTNTVTFATVYGTSGFTNFTVTGDVALRGGAWTHVTNTVIETNRLRVTVGGDLFITNATINADGRGYIGGYGPGRPVYDHGGPGHGGLGGGGWDSGARLPDGFIYDSITSPVNLGSGGGRSDTPTTVGGGAVILVVASNLVVYGTISANGVFSGDTSSSGGSVNITAGTINGNGTIRANGGTGSYTGAGGGRLAVKLTQAGADFSGFSGTMTAYGGNQGTSSGSAGTVYKQIAAQADGQGTLVIDNGNRTPWLMVYTPMPALQDLNAFAQIVITNKGDLGVNTNNTLDFGLDRIAGAGPNSAYITIVNPSGVTFPGSYTISNYTLVADGLTSVTGNWTIAANGVLTHRDNWHSEMFKIGLTIEGNLTVQTSGAINVDGRGYRGGYGPGTPLYAHAGPGHGGIGGFGADGDTAPSAATYDSAVNPTNIGSGGGRSDGPSTAGGGAVILVVTSNLVVNGSISANGVFWGDTSSSGGSLNITARTIGGNGTISANAGTGSYTGAGGGRVALTLTQAGADFTGFTGVISTYGGVLGNKCGAAGTVYLQDGNDSSGAGDLILNNNNTVTTSSVLTHLTAALNPLPTELAKATVLVTNKVNAGLPANCDIRDLLLNSNCTLNLAGKRLYVDTPEHSLAGTVYTNGGQIVWWSPIFNTTASNITTDAADLGGMMVTSVYTTTSMGLWVYWGTTDGGRVKTAWATNAFVASNPPRGSLSFPVTNLTADSYYYYRYYMTNEAAGSWNDVWAEPSSPFITSSLWLEKTADGSKWGPSDGTFVVHRASSFTNTPLQVQFAISGTAAEGVDYTLSATGRVVTIPAGQSSAPVTVQVSPIDNTNAGTVVISLVPGAYIVGTPSTVTVQIAAGPVMRVWDGGGANTLASNPMNWSGDTLPGAGEYVVLNATSQKAMEWDAAAPGTIAGWLQYESYTGTVTISTEYSGAYTNLTISQNLTILGGRWTHVANPSGETAVRRLHVTVGGNFTLGSSARINADGLGFRGYYGPGKPAGGGGQQHGAGHGGLGGLMGGSGASGAVYGSIHNPETLGSGGGRSDSPNAAGGGAVILVVVGDAVVVGTISANGVFWGDTNGSGGSVNLVARTLSGAGTINANGGAGNYAGSGGGRVAVKLTQAGADFSSFTGSMTAWGGNQSQSSGAAGTVYRQTQAQAAGQGTLVIDNGDRAPYLTGICTVAPSGVSLNDFAQIVISNKGNLGVTAGDTLDFGLGRIVGAGATSAYITILSPAGVTFPVSFVISNYTLVADSVTSVTGNWTVATNGILTQRDNYHTEVYKLSMTVNGDLTVQAGGAINVDGRGYRGAWGPGTPAYAHAGAAYGGIGGYGQDGDTAPSAVTYGSIMNPTNPGSGGGRSDSPATAGGGAAILTVTGNLVVNGSISANGVFWGDTSSSGGSVNITARTISGSGSVSANAGTGSYTGAGGGRVAVTLTQPGVDFSGFAGTMTAYGGNLGARSGAPGTVYRKAADTDTGAGTVIVDNGATATNQAFTSLPAFSNSAERIIKTVWMTTNKARLGLLTNAAIEGLTLNANGVLELAGYTLTVRGFTVTNRVYKNGIYGPHDIPISLLTDAGSSGKVIVHRSVGSVFVIH